MSKSYGITMITSTICELMELRRPWSAEGKVIDEVVGQMKKLGIHKVEKFLFYTPDAIGKKMVLKFKDEFNKVRKPAPIEIDMKSVFPPKTPVCYASMFTGTMPDYHGIQAYEKPCVMTISLFDSLVRYRSGNQAASIAVKDSSLDIIFRKRPIKYFTEKYDSEVNARALELIDNHEFDFILVYNQEYDDSLHETGIESPRSIQAMKNHVNSFLNLINEAEKSWKGFNRAYLFAPDHGAHDFPEGGKGTHGDDIPDDMDIIHFWGIYKRG